MTDLIVRGKKSSIGKENDNDNDNDNDTFEW